MSRRRTVAITPANSTVNGEGSTAYVRTRWWQTARWRKAWTDPSFAVKPGCTYLHVPSGKRRGYFDDTVFRVRPADRLGPRRAVKSREHGRAETAWWCWEPV